MGKILVTGGAGFIGSHLIDELVKRSFKVKTLDIFEKQVHKDGKPDYLNKGCEYIEGDIRDERILKRALKDVDIIFHFAAQVGVGQSMYEIHRYVDHNTLGTANLLNFIVKNKIKLRKLIVASSMSIYGEGGYKCKSCGEVSCDIRPEAQLLKRDWEMRCPNCEAQVESIKIPTVGLRFFNVYGPRQSLSNPYTGVCAIFSSMIKDNRNPTVYEDGAQTRDFINVRDIVVANMLVMEKDEADYGTYNVGTGRPVPVLDIADILIKLYGKKVRPEIVNKFRVGDIRHCFADISKIKKLGFMPSVGLEEGLAELVEWGRSQATDSFTNAADKELEKMGLKI
ncbi:MAG: NAD-dependent epimerase/dehydratase family protein [Candidatus Omnitrophica bacterium]|nr:NAD-dependent epimerase/dehydratase family protein [Candidatus Omnitrophota bacterium]